MAIKTVYVCERLSCGHESQDPGEFWWVAALFAGVDAYSRTGNGTLIESQHKKLWCRSCMEDHALVGVDKSRRARLAEKEAARDKLLAKSLSFEELLRELVRDELQVG